MHIMALRDRDGWGRWSGHGSFFRVRDAGLGRPQDHAAAETARVSLMTGKPEIKHF
jgi:hypothetical protein